LPISGRPPLSHFIPEAGDRNQRRDDDPEHLDPGVDPADVVDQAERRDHQRSQQDPEVGALGLDVDGDRDGDGDHDPEPADARDRLGAVDARAVGLVVDAADPRREPDDSGSEREDDAGRGQEPPDRVAVAKERVQRVREGHWSGYS
jgi:hypothetical protein